MAGSAGGGLEQTLHLPPGTLYYKLSWGGILASTSPLKLCFMACRSSLPSGKIGCLRAGVAQLVEQLICNQPVGGSTPLASSRFFLNSLCFQAHNNARKGVDNERMHKQNMPLVLGGVPEWPKGSDCKSDA